jgi:oligopeptide transport system substrate-binding protein
MSGSKISRRARLLFSCGALLAFSACGKRDSTTSPGQILRISQRNEPADLDPQLATIPDEFFVLRAISEGLVTPAPDGGVLPGVAEKWETSPDGLTWTFHLRANARWSNGAPVVASDFVFSYRRTLTPALAAPKARLFFAVKNAAAYFRGALADFSQVGFAAPDGRTLVIRLEHPTPHLLALAASGPWLPVHPATVVKFHGTARRGTAWTRPGNFVGNGPFLLRAWHPNQAISVTKNPAYWDAAQVRLAEIRFVAMDNGDSEERAFRAGQLDVTLSVPTTKLAAYEAARPAVLHRVMLAETRYLAVNTQRPPLNDARVRRALSLALDRAALTGKVLKGGQIPGANFIPPGLGGYQPAPTLATAETDAAALLAARTEARRLFVEAGFPEGRGFPRLEVSSWAITPTVLEAMQQMWRQELGIEVGLVQREAKVHLAALAAGNYDLGFMPAIADYLDAASLFEELTAGAAGNYPHWTDAHYDALVLAAGRESDTARRSALYREAEALLLRELPVIPLYFNSQNFLLSPRVRGWQTDRLWNRFYKSVYLE